VRFNTIKNLQMLCGKNEFHFYSNTTQMHQFLKFIYFWTTLYMFRRSFRPSSGIQDCTYSNRYMSNRYCCLLTSKQIAVDGTDRLHRNFGNKLPTYAA